MTDILLTREEDGGEFDFDGTLRRLRSEFSFLVMNSGPDECQQIMKVLADLKKSVQDAIEDMTDRPA